MPNKLTYFSYNSRVGHITIAASKRGITLLQFGSQTIPDADYAPSALTNEAATQVQEYFAGKRREFDVALDIDMSDFCQEVWQAIQAIPYGHAASAAQIAETIGKPQSTRSVGSALSLAPCELLIPLHRVVSAHGRTRGTGEIARQHELLLAFEQAQLEKSLHIS